MVRAASLFLKFDNDAPNEEMRKKKKEKQNLKRKHMNWTEHESIYSFMYWISFTHSASLGSFNVLLCYALCTPMFVFPIYRKCMRVYVFKHKIERRQTKRTNERHTNKGSRELKRNIQDIVHVAIEGSSWLDIFQCIFGSSVVYERIMRCCPWIPLIERNKRTENEN